MDKYCAQHKYVVYIVTNKIYFTVICFFPTMFDYISASIINTIGLHTPYNKLN